MDNTEKWLAELENSEAIQNYFKGFTDHSVKNFKEHYIRVKSYWHQSLDRNTDSNEYDQLKWIHTAFRHLEVILQKKLFDAQCLWRAEKETFEGVEICEDFEVWQHDVLNCPFIEPVNEDDIYLYAQYLHIEQAEEEFNHWQNWQNYEDIKEAHNNENADEEFPEWYDFHNNRTGSGSLLLLPDIRGEKEAFYYQLHFAEQRKANKEKEKQYEEQRDKRPSLAYYDDKVIQYFINTFENKKVQNAYREYTHANRHNHKEERLHEIIEELLRTDEVIPIEAHEDWSKALEIALKRYRCKKIAEALPAALEQYRMNIEMGIAFPSEKRDNHDDIRQMWLENILKGRKLNGDPEDLNF